MSQAFSGEGDAWRLAPLGLPQGFLSRCDGPGSGVTLGGQCTQRRRLHAAHAPKGRSPMGQTAPVTDWTTDFDVMDPEYLTDPFSIWDELRQTCPILHTDRRKSSWMPLRYEDVTAI